MWTKTFLAACAAMMLVAGRAQADSFLTAPMREIGPHIAAQTTPAPGGGWQISDDRTLGASIVGQQGWTGTCSNQNYDQEIAAGVAHSGGHGWRLSNWYHNGCVNHVISPAYAPVGENGSTTIINQGGSGPSTNTVVYEFWFRSAATQPDPGTFASTTITDQAGRRMTYLGFFDESPGPGGQAGNGCPTNNGCFHLDASGVTDGGTPGDDNSVVFDDNYSPALNRGQWYRVHIDATFNDTNGESTRRNDLVNYSLYDAAGNQVWAANGVNTWEDAYYAGHYGSNPGDKVASSYIAYRISSDPDTADQSDGDSYSVANRPHGIVFDDLKVTPGDGQQGYATSFDYDRYVATTGTDTGDCRNQAAPCKTITYAIAQCNPYDTIHVAPGMYAENSGGGANLVVNKPVAIEGAQTGIDARTRDIGGASDASETIIVPAVVDPNLTLGSIGESAVVQINASGVSLDGVIVDGDNHNLISPSAANPINLNGSNPDVDSGIFAVGSNITLQNIVVRNVGATGILADNTNGPVNTPGGDNLIQLNRFTNITNPSTWGIGIYAADNFYAQISDNLMDQVRVGIQTENNSSADPGTQAPAVLRNEIHATRTALFHNLFYGSATTYTFTGNHLIAVLNAGQAGQWNGMQIESMQGVQTVLVQGNTIDGSALAGVRTRVGYVLNNWTQSPVTAIDGGTISNVDVGVLATDATNYTGPVNGALVTNITFSNISLGAIYVEDTNEIAGSPAVTIGAGNTYPGVVHELVLAGAAPSVSFSGIAGMDTVLVRSKRTYLYARADTSGACNIPANPNDPLCSVANASINAGIAAASAGATVYLEQGTFDEMGVIGTGKDNLRLTAADTANPPTITRLGGGPNSPLLVVAGMPGAAPKGVVIDHLNFAVDKLHAAEGLLVSGFVDGLLIDHNQFVQSAGATSGTASYKYTNAISINIDPQHNSLGLPRVDGSNVTIQNNTISGSTAPNATKFRAGIAMDGGVGTIANNTSAGLNHDAIVRFATVVAGGSNGVSITGNTFGGGGLEFDAPNAGISPIAITANSITAAAGSPALNLTQGQLEADISVLRLIDNFQRLPVTVSGNTLAGYANGYRGALVENFPNATFSNNTFTPLAGAADFASLVVSNKEINTDNPPEAPYPMSFTALHNTFNGSGASNAGRAVELIDDNDTNGNASFGAVTFGSNLPADANSFDSSQRYYFNLVDQNCDTNLSAVGPTPGGVSPQCNFLDYNDDNAPGGLPNTQVRPFRGIVHAVNNLFGGVAPRAMSPVQQAQLNTQTNDINDDAALGYVDYGLSSVVLALDGPVANVQATVPADYSAELTNTGPALSENAVVHLAIGSDRAGGIQAGDVTAEYFDGSSYQPLPLTLSAGALVVAYGPPGGFAVPHGYDVTTQFRFTFSYANGSGGTHYSAAASVVGVTTGTIYAADMHTTNVVQSAANIGLNLMGPQSVTAGTAVPGYSARLTNTGGAASENVLVHFAISRSGGIGAGDIGMQYFDGSAYQTISLNTCGANLCGTFGPQPGGFPVGVGYDVATQLQVSYTRSGVFIINASVDGAISQVSYASSALTVNVAPGPATTIAAYGPVSFTGTAGSALATTPAVIATDANGNPVPGVTVAFAAGSNSGTLSGTNPVTDANGIATLGGWMLGTAATETVSATAPVATGTPVTFTAAVTAQFDIAVSMSNGRDYVQYGRTLDYVIVVTNSGPSAALSVQVTDNLPPELDGVNASWICFHSDGATCAASGSGNLSDTASIPSGGSATYVLSASVITDPNLLSDIIVNSANVSAAGDGSPANNAASCTTQIVIFRDGLEPGGDGSQSAPSDFSPPVRLDETATLTLEPAQAPPSGAMPTMWLRATDAQGRAVFRVEAMREGNNILARIVSLDEVGQEKRSAWIALAQQASAGLALGSSTAAREVMLVAQTSDVRAAIPSWAALPLQVYAVQ